MRQRKGRHHLRNQSMKRNIGTLNFFEIQGIIDHCLGITPICSRQDSSQLCYTKMSMLFAPRFKDVTLWSVCNMYSEDVSDSLSPQALHNSRQSLWSMLSNTLPLFVMSYHSDFVFEMTTCNWCYGSTRWLWEPYVFPTLRTQHL